MTRLPSLGPRGEGWVVIQVVLFVLVVAAGAAGPVVDGAARIVLAAGGAVLVAAGGLLAVRGVLDLDDALTPLPHPRAGAALVESGSYRLVRHPIYGGIVLASTGWALLTASPPALVGAAVLLAFFRLKSSREEAWLRSHYAGYAAYAARTKRLIPWVY